jgi:hypothetical protein
MDHPDDAGGHFSASRPAEGPEAREAPRLAVSSREGRMRPGRGQFLGFLTSGSTWAIVCCVAGVSSIVMPWRFTSLPLGTEWWAVRGTVSWHGIALGSVFGAGALLFLATYSAGGWGLWKPLLHILVGGVCLGFVLAYALMDDQAVVRLLQPLVPRVEPGTIKFIVPGSHQLGWGLYVAGGAAVALLVVAALEINAYFFWKRREAGPC